MLEELTSASESLNDMASRESEFSVLLQQACGQVPQIVPGVDAVSFTLFTDGNPPRTVASTTDLVGQVDARQYTDGNGPCLEASQRGTPVCATIADQAASWPVFADAALAAGVSSVLSVPLTVDGSFHGAMNCYGLESRPFRELDVEMLELYVTAVEGTLAGERRYRQAKDGETETN